MNILFIIGNGFDLNLGLETSYEDFYRWYLESYSEPKENVVDFINEIKKKKPNNSLWSCMEIALGEYTKHMKSENIVEEYTNLHDNIVEAMSIFIKEQEGKFDLTKISRTKFNNYFINPESYADLKLAEIKRFQDLRARYANNISKINIITFNYSSSLEIIAGLENGAQLGSYYQDGRGKIQVSSIEHIHGTVDDRLIVGVNDLSQVKNEALHKTRAKDYIVKPFFNALCGEEHDERCQKYINNSNLIVLFGCSFGGSDLKWWNSIITRMKRGDVLLLIFNYKYGIGFDSLNKHKKQHYLDDVKDDFIAKSSLQLTEQEKQRVKDNIFIGHNTTMFSPIAD